MNAAELIADALVKAESVSSEVRKAALLRISRVQTVVMPAQAEATLQSGLAVDHGLLYTQDFGFEELTRLTVAAVAPQRLITLPPASARGMRHDIADCLARVMIEHGHTEYLKTYVLRDAPLADIPLGGIRNLMLNARDEEEGQLLLWRAIEAWRVKRRSARSRVSLNHQFFPLFRTSWKLLPREEAVATLSEIIDDVLEQPDAPVNGRIGELSFTSIHALEIFQNVDLLLHLNQRRAQELIEAHPELADAIRRYPNGLQSMEEEAEAERAKLPPRDPSQQTYIICARDLEYARAVLEAKKTGDYSKPLEYASARYREDVDSSNPNGALKAFWGSAATYRTIFYNMGKSLREAAQLKLDSILDSDLKLFAQIELAAGLCGLPELSSVSQRQGTPGR